MDNGARLIVQTALLRRISHASAPALAVLDLAMSGQTNSDPDFTDCSTPAGDLTDPSTPFGRLLRDAFAPEISDIEIASRDISARTDVFWLRWDAAVIRPFAIRYALWATEPSTD